MGFEKCKAAISAAAGRDLTDREMAELFREIDKRAGNINTAEARLKAAEDIAADVTLAVMLEKRAAAINAQRFIEAKDYIENVWGDKRHEGLQALIVGAEGARKGSRFSVAADQHQLTGAYLAGLVHDIRGLSDGHLAVFTSGTLDREIAQALWAIDNPEAPKFKGPKEAQDIAGAIAKWQETARIRMNRAGALVGKMPGYIARQSHDQRKIYLAGKAKWVADVRGKLDIQRTIGSMADKDIEDFLSNVYDGLASGNHLRTAEGNDGKMGGFKGFANVAKRVSQERVLHFKSADDWFEYNQVYGSGNLRESVIRGLERSAHTTALMRTLGTNPQGMVERLVRDQMGSLKGKPDAERKLKNRIKAIDNRLAEVDGRTRIPVNSTLAQVGAVTRAWQSMAKLGGAVITSITDLPLMAAELKYQGRNFLSGIGDGIAGLIRGRPKGEQQEILEALGVYFDSMRGLVINRFSANDSLGGAMTRAQGTFFKLNGMSWWTEVNKASMALVMSNRLGTLAKSGWESLPPELTRVLSLYGIDGGKWDILRSTGAKLADGREYLTPEGLADMDDAMFAAYLKARGQEPTPKRIATLREEIAAQYRAYITDRTDYGVLTPDMRTRAILRQGTQPGTPLGEVARWVGQFKAFPFAFSQKIIGRAIYGQGADSLGEALRNGHGEWQAFGQLIGTLTLFGYGAMATKDMLRGREPRDPLDKDTVMAAMMQGGGLGIYGDFLFGQANRYGGSTMDTAAGPMAGAVFGGLDLWAGLRSGDKVAADAFRLAVSNTPYLNLFYTRAAMDYAVLYRIQEALSPGYLRRMEQRMKRENQQEYIVSPSEAVR